MVSKSDSRLCAAIDVCLRVLTLGRQSRFLSEYHTVLGEKLYLAPTFALMTDDAKYVLLRHERIHLRQRKRYGSFLMALLYLLPIFPMGLALGRARIEWEAYEETLRASAELYGLRALEQSNLKQFIINRFTGPDYGYMWPFPSRVAKWYEEAVAKIRTEVRENPEVTLNTEGHR
jgi:hypothetical protein